MWWTFSRVLRRKRSRLLGRTSIFLSEHLSQVDRVVDRRLPGLCLERESRSNSFRYWRELEEIPSDNKLGSRDMSTPGRRERGTLTRKVSAHLNPTKRSSCHCTRFPSSFLERRTDLSEFVKQDPINHRDCIEVLRCQCHFAMFVRLNQRLLTFINDENFAPLPFRIRVSILLDLVDQLLRALDSNSDSRKRVNRSSTNVARGHSSRSRDCDGIGVSSVFAFERSNDFSQEDRLSRT